ncbi:hypothetical protein [Streptomyces durocortorensis]|uniref:hypothetical protein n=1 Tax=Streptomyces durocortorensis TaxID=2811104 RepID=UPI001EF5ACCD|nr:hypothetical protein [Streptomyces durocortorensis]
MEFESEQGPYFSGRAGVLGELVAWLGGEDDDGRGRIVTGSPGCGKAAALGRIVALSDEGYRTALDLSGVDPATVVPVGLVAAAVHARHKRFEEVVERIGAVPSVRRRSRPSMSSRAWRKVCCSAGGRRPPPSGGFPARRSRPDCAHPAWSSARSTP